MSVEELVKRLRAWADDRRMWGSADQDLKHAAYKLEELAAWNAMLEREAEAHYDAGHYRAMSEHATPQRIRAEAAEAALAEKNKALQLAEFMLTKDSLCQSERLEEGLTVIRRARNAGGKDGQ